MKTSIATVCISGTLEEKLAACAAAGFDGVELFEQDLITSPLSPEEVRERAARLGLTLDLYQPFRDLEGVEPEQFALNLERLEAKFQLMDRLGIDTILVCSNVDTATVHDDAIIADQLRQAGELAARYGKRIAYEALAWGTYVNTFWHSWELARAAEHEAIGVCIDSFHILSRGDDPSRIAEIPGEKIFFVQLADAQPMGMDVLPWSRHHRVFPGEGGFDVVEMVRLLTHAGYSGPLSLEIFNDVFRETDPAVTAVDGKRSLIWLQQRVRGRLGADDPLRDTLDGVPKIDPVERIDHIELISDRPDELGNVLDSIGFTLVGRHRRKDALLFRVGSTLIVLTPAATGGTRIASIAVSVDDAVAAADRAVELGAARASRPVTAGEADLPGVIASEEWQLFFVDAERSEWPLEFSDTQRSPAGGETDEGPRFDHLHLTETRGRFTATTLFLESVLRMDRTAPVDVPSHRGLVRTQLLQSPGRVVNIVLGVAPTHGSDLADSRYPVHVAFEVADVEAIAERAAQRGASTFDIPGNYYDDLGARFGIDADTLASWRRLGLFYDRNDSGEYLHFYTRTVGRTFFEIVERRDGYTGYGHTNTPVRLSAQEVLV